MLYLSDFEDICIITFCRVNKRTNWSNKNKIFKKEGFLIAPAGVWYCQVSNVHTKILRSSFGQQGQRWHHQRENRSGMTGKGEPSVNTQSPKSHSYFKQKIKLASGLSAKIYIECISRTSGRCSELNMRRVIHTLSGHQRRVESQVLERRKNISIPIDLQQATCHNRQQRENTVLLTSVSTQSISEYENACVTSRWGGKQCWRLLSGCLLLYKLVRRLSCTEKLLKV